MLLREDSLHLGENRRTAVPDDPEIQHALEHLSQ
jgi:hypothetical protein